MKTTLLLSVGLLAAALAPASALAQARPKPKPQTTLKAPVKTPAPKAPAARPVARPAAPASAPVAPAARPAPAPAPAAAGGGPFEVGSNVLNLGIGVGSRYGYGANFLGGSSSVSPALSLSYERGVMPLGPGVLGVGGFVGYQSAKLDFGSGNSFSYTDIIVMVRGAFHYPVTPEFDAYGGLGVGVRRLSDSFSGAANSPYLLAGSSASTDLTSGLFLGGRYYFGPRFGAFAELGYDQTYLKIGLAVKL